MVARNLVKVETLYGEARRLVWVFLSAILLLSSVIHAPAKPYAYVPNEGSDNVSVIDTANNTVVTNINVALNPIRLAITPDNKKVYVACHAADRVSVIATESNKVIKTILVGDVPAEVLVTPSGNRVYIPNAGTQQGGPGTISVINTATDTVITNLPASFNCRAIAWVSNAAGNWVYVANQGQGTVTVIDDDTQTIEDTVPVGSGPRRLAVSPDNTRVYATNFQSDSITVINALTHNAITGVSVGDGPRGIAVTPDGKEVWVANLNTNYVSVITTSNNHVSATVPVGGGCWTVVINRAGTRAYVISSGDKNCYVVDTATKTVLTTIPIGFGAFWAEFNWEQTRLYVTNPPDDDVSVLDLVTNTRITDVTTGMDPWIVAVASNEAPALVEVVPTNVVAGTSVPVTVTGSNLLDAATLAVWPVAADITVTNVQYQNADTLTATLATTTNAPTGPRGLIVTNPDGQSATNAALFTITAPPPPVPPLLTGATPDELTAGDTVMMQLWGEGFQSNTTVTLMPADAGVTLNDLVIPNGTNISLTVTTTTNAVAGLHGFIVTNPSGASATNTMVFLINPPPLPPPLVSAVLPDTLIVGGAVTMDVFGANFQDGAVLAVTPTNNAVVLTDVTVQSSTNITMTVSIETNAATGVHGFIVTNPDAQSGTNAVLFTIVLPAPVLVSASPTNVTAGTSVPMSVFGTGIQSNALLEVSPLNGEIGLADVVVVNETNVTLTVSITSNSVTGAHGFIVTNPDGQSNTNNALFDVQAAPPPPPTLVSAAPDEVTAGAAVSMTVTGTGLQTNAIIVLTPDNAGVSLLDDQVTGETAFTVTVDVGTNATFGAHGFILTNPDGQSATNDLLFEIVAPALPPPTLTAASPDQVSMGTEVLMALAGSGFQSNATVLVTPENLKVMVAGLTVLDDTNIVLTIAVSSNSVAGAHGFIVENPDGQSVTNANLFAILELPAIVSIEELPAIGFVITWTTAPDTTNQVMSVESLDGSWQDLPGGEVVAGPGETSLSYTDTTATVTTTQRFYRIRRRTPP